MDDIRAQKQVLRKEIRAKLKSVTSLEEQSAQVWNRVYELPVYQQATSVGLFVSMPSCEIQTDSILHHATEHSKRVYVPQVGANFEQADMDMILCPATPSFHKAWPVNKWNIPEPPLDMERIIAKPGDIDLLIVPGLAFDSHGGRLGQGKGYYDRFIQKMRAQHSKPRLVAVGLRPQLVERIPMDEHDYVMEVVVLPDQTIQVSKSME